MQRREGNSRSCFTGEGRRRCDCESDNYSHIVDHLEHGEWGDCVASRKVQAGKHFATRGEEIERMSQNLGHVFRAPLNTQVFLGDQSVGKTSIITRFMYDKFDNTYQV